MGFHWQFGVVQGGSLSAPVASFNVSVPAGPTALVVDFTDTSSNSPTSWTWAVVTTPAGCSTAFTNGTNANTQNPQITFTNPTAAPVTFQVRLTATNAAGSGVGSAPSGLQDINVIP